MARIISEPCRHLSRADPVMRRLIRDIGPFLLKPRMRRSPFESLVWAIAYQQLHDKAAESILKRLIALCPGQRFPRPDQLVALSPGLLRGAGVSQAKAESGAGRPRCS